MRVKRACLKLEPELGGGSGCRECVEVAGVVIDMAMEVGEELKKS